MSKKKKASPGKAGKKLPVKKTAKKAVKPVAKKKAMTKSASHPVKAKKAAAKSPLKSKSQGKKITLKSVVKKIAKVAKAKIKSLTNSKKTTSKNTTVKKNTAKPSPVHKAIASKVNNTVKNNKNNNHQPHKHNGVSKELPKSREIPHNNKGVTKTAAPVEDKKKIIEPPTKKQQAEKKSQDVLAITNTIPVKKKNEISPSKIASISYSITNPVKRTDSYAVKPEKEPAGKFELEFVVHSSAEMLYEFLSSPSGLSEWFCDDLNIRNGIYTFIWDDQLQQARLLKTVDLHLVRFQWVDKTDGSYFEFKIQRDDLTNDISLIITDFAETVSERESSKLLWHSQVEKLMHVIGSIF